MEEDENDGRESDKKSEDLAQAAEHAGKTKHDSENVQESELARDAGAKNEEQEVGIWQEGKQLLSTAQVAVVFQSSWVKQMVSRNALSRERRSSLSQISVFQSGKSYKSTRWCLFNVAHKCLLPQDLLRQQK